MSRARYDESNHAKASFDEAYVAPTPHRYLASMAAIDYRLAERMHPFLSAVVDASSPAEAPLRVLDVTIDDIRAPSTLNPPRRRQWEWPE